MLMPSSGFAAASEAAGPVAASTASGAFQLPWATFSLIMFIATLKQPIIMRVFLGFIFLTFFLGTLGGFLLNPALTKASGWVSILLSMTAYYGTAALLYNKEITYFTLPIGAPKHE
jgi:succinate-acetate transporter protein